MEGGSLSITCRKDQRIYRLRTRTLRGSAMGDEAIRVVARSYPADEGVQTLRAGGSIVIGERHPHWAVSVIEISHLVNSPFQSWICQLHILGNLNFFRTVVR